jgi:iron complex outermembrane recepter protein
MDAEPVKNLHLNLASHYVGAQFIDNTSSSGRRLDPYFINDVRVSYSIFPKWISELSFQLQVLNIFNVAYESNAWIYRYYYQGEQGVYDGYYPQAGLHFMTGVRLKF